ncbi:hypothetical protein HBI56_149090 [Parastagonospora nodorum]|uniref:Coupling of ubiquitin conjugation to ER degradation protein 1 n=1 Tax=Phaeosphaeria nodorum (strain SN15 / ATCC MYA-4574 / FGSC 10173) TaxID=321614 RepID=A0A7U2NQK1_PHANO|nr:hypothetical protein HBH56_075770 [Parastagonospora nodorum]QRD06840.1 hypothetical protein JI435_127440 [Parastagonospora nodorum SN15]KAH3927299.1 hypothetical protein HBH54_156010 [Parastagonospora nodorum]KAH3951903.1 hypothetical protein HBH53_052380 [Parastagonospora nodorum]KAH3982012.1 hypothetical protein HBH51_042720 [Parastagonospora nodorum]
MTEQSINIPQVLVFLVVIFLASRWYLSKPSGAHTHAAPARSTPRINPAQIDQIAAMFPQLSRRDIAWDLQRNGGNASATTERVLGGRGLDTPPPSFNLPTPGPTAQIRVTSARPASKPAQPDLITRYNLSSKLAQSEEPAKEEAPKKAWSADKNERQMNLQRRREEMILAARRKLEAQEKGKAPA